MTIPVDVIAHCEKFKFCKGCPLRTCVVPESDAKYQEWLEGRIIDVRAIIESSNGVKNEN